MCFVFWRWKASDASETSVPSVLHGSSEIEQSFHRISKRGHGSTREPFVTPCAVIMLGPETLLFHAYYKHRTGSSSGAFGRRHEINKDRTQVSKDVVSKKWSEARP